MDLFTVVDKFQLHLLTRDWIDAQWQQDFSSDKELPTDYALALEGEDYFELLTLLNESFNSWMTSSDMSFNGDVWDGPSTSCAEPPFSGDVSVAGTPSSSSSDRRSWQTLLNADVNHRALVAVVSTFLKADVKELTDDVSRRLALAASRVYFTILSVRGAQIFKVFNAILFGQAIESLKVFNIMSGDQKIPNPEGEKRRAEESYENPPEIDDTDVIHISNSEKEELIRTLIHSLSDLKRCLETFNLKGEDDVLTLTITALVSVARLEKNVSTFVRVCPKGRTVTYLANRAYNTLMALCRPGHGELSNVVRMICRSLLLHLLMSAQEMHTNDKTKAVVRAHMISFVQNIVDKCRVDSYDGVMALVQQLCIRTPDKADIRSRCVQQIFTILNLFPPPLYRRTVLWICSMVFADAVKARVMGVELVAKILSGVERDGPIEEEDDSRGPETILRDDEDNDGDDRRERDDEELEDDRVNLIVRKNVSHRFLLGVLISRAVDVSPTVRVKALSAFAPMILPQSHGLREIMAELFITPYADSTDLLVGVNDSEPPFFDFQLFFRRKNIDPPENPLPGGTRVMKLMQSLTLDQKVFVRKAALHVMCNICRLNRKWITQERVDIMVLNCLDFSVIVRKMMIQCLTELLIECPSNKSLIKAWVQGVVPLVADNELKCQEKSLEALGFVILENLRAYQETRSNLQRLPWLVIRLFIEFDMRKLFQFVCRHWVTAKRIGAREMKVVHAHVETENDAAAWYFIVCISEFTDFYNPNSFVEYYLNNIYSKPVQEYKSQLVLEALFLNWRNIDHAIMDNLVQNKLIVSLESFTLPLSSIAPITNICIQHNEQSFADTAKIIISKCENYLSRHIGPNSPIELSNEDALTRHIFTLGEANTVSPRHFSKAAVPLLRSLIDSLLDTDTLKWQGKVGSVCKAVTVCTLGKFCLQDQMLAKELVPVLGTLMNPTTPMEVKLNTLNTMADLCVRFTSLVEPYLGDMCVCLKDQEVRVRKTTLDLMIRLIQEDYIKLKCPYFYYILHLLQDPEPLIRSTTKSFIVNTVMAKNPKIMVHEFIQALYFLNEYEANEAMVRTFSTISLNPNEKKAFLMSGNGNKSKRRELLCFMLEHMVDDFKFKTLNSICNEILDGVSDDKIPLNNRGIPLISDAIFVLGCEELRMSSNKNKNDETDDDEFGQGDNGESGRFIALAVSCLLKQLYQENVIPSVIKFKRKLQEAKSSLLRDLMVSLRSMMKGFKDWMQEILSSDPQLASEIELDMRVLEEEGCSSED